MMDKLKNFLDTSFSVGQSNIHLWDILEFIIIIVITRLIAWVFGRFILDPLLKRKQLNKGRTFAIKRITNYAIYVMGFTFALVFLGAKFFSVIPLSALLVGVGIGLQQTFNDVFSGLIILFEDSINVGDVVEVEGNMIGRVQEIGVRNSKIKTRENISVIVPNSKIIVNNVINWSYQSKTSMFRINVGVAYGSDVELVEKLLKLSANEHPDVRTTPEPRVIFVDFGNSSLDFQLFFASDKLMEIEFIKSDIRKHIDSKFRENGVTIPFPQRDLHIKSGKL